MDPEIKAIFEKADNYKRIILNVRDALEETLMDLEESLGEEFDETE